MYKPIHKLNEFLGTFPNGITIFCKSGIRYADVILKLVLQSDGLGHCKFLCAGVEDEFDLREFVDAREGRWTGDFRQDGKTVIISRVCIQGEPPEVDELDILGMQLTQPTARCSITVHGQVSHQHG